MATGRTKDLSGIRSAYRIRSVYSGAVRASPEAPGRAVARGLSAPEPAAGTDETDETDEYAEEAHHVPGDALLEHWRFPS